MRKWIVFACCFVLAASVLLAEKTYAPKIDALRIRETVKYLSSDELEGRGTGQKGGDVAADWIAEQFKSYGLKPAGANGTYFQEVPMVGVKTLSSTTFAFVPLNGAPVELKNLDDFVTSDEAQKESADIDAPIVYVGYGITSPENKWDDYKGYDLRGKVALLFVSEPESNDPNFFKGKALTYSGRWTYKYEETARRGAVATLIIHRTDLASYPWEVVRNSWGGERSFLQLDGTPKLQAASWIQLEVARKLVGMAGLDLDKLYQQAQSREFKPIELPVHLKAHIASSIRPFSSRNVIGMVRGDPTGGKQGEAVLYTAHYDHFGIDYERPKGDQIYHGAVDNATGCGILLELARVWAGTKPLPRRSILFAAVTAEEQGLLGSEYLGKHLNELPVQPILDLNYDALAPLGIPEEVEVSGAERTTFYPEVEKIAKEFNLTIKPDAHPEAGHYYRSDHFSLGRVGIPAFSISEGLKFKGHDLAWGDAQSKDYVANHYHKPSDAFVDTWDFAGDAKMAGFGYALGQAASSSTDIKWLPGDEFEPAQRKLREGSINGRALLADHPELHALRLEPVQYPLLAKRTRIMGSVIAMFVVARDGSVKNINFLSGHTLLRQAVAEAVSKWKFQELADGEVELTLTCDFGSSENWNFDRPAALITQPMHLTILVPPVMWNP
jgi:Zn-dependent M28 family amino/carboxypeptidase